MRLTNDRNGVTPAISIAIFLLVGCTVFVVGFIAGVEAPVLQFGVIAYVFLAGPVLLTSFGSGGQTRHASFLPTSLPHMEGKRVKPRLKGFATVCAATTIAAPFVTISGVLIADREFELIDMTKSGGALALMGAVAFSFLFARIVFAYASVWIGWITRDEAGEFLASGRRWPETWLDTLKPDPKK